MKLRDYQEQLIEQIKRLNQEEGRDVSRLSGAYERVIDLVQNDITNQDQGE